MTFKKIFQTIYPIKCRSAATQHFLSAGLFNRVHPVKCRSAATQHFLKSAGLFNRVNRNEWIFLFIVSIVVIIATSLPYIYGYLTAPEDTYFLAVSPVNKIDYSNYFSYIEQVRQGHFLFKDLYTTESQPRIIFNLFFLVLGFFAKFLRLSALAIFHIARIILIPIFILVFYFFASFLYKEVLKRKFALLFICFSSGLGAILSVLTSNLPPLQQPLDLWSPEAITFLAFYANPLYIFSLILIVGIFFLTLLSLKKKKYKYSLFSGFFGLILFQIHPYDVPTILLILSSFWLFLFIKDRKNSWFYLKHCLIFLVISTPSLIYYLWLSNTHWLTIHRISQAAPMAFTPPFFSVFISYGLIWLLVLIGIFRPLKNHFFIFLIIWLIGQTCLIYSPIPLQRKLLEGIHPILSLLAAHGLFIIYQYLKQKLYWQKNIVLRNKFLWISIFIFLFCFSNVVFMIRDIKIYQESHHFIPQDLIKTMIWLNKNSPKESNILANPDYWETNNLIPAFALRKVYIGHMCETAYFEIKRKELFWFFSNNEYDLEKEKWLKDKNINYILVHENAKNIFQPQEKLYLKNIFENNTVSVYQTL